MDLYQILIVGHIIGTALGLGGAVVAEVQITRALKDSIVSNDERYLMHGTYFLIRVGLGFIILSGLGLVFYYLNDGFTWVLNSPKLWVKEIMVGVIIINAILLTKRLVPLWLGSALSFASWLGATILGAAGKVDYSFANLIIAYIGLIAVTAITLHLVKKIYLPAK